MIDAANLTKRFNNFTAVNDVSLHVDKGRIFGLLGPNAAGKTTVIRMLCGILECDEGEVRLNGLNINKAKTYFGYVAQHFGQYEDLSVWENLKFYASMYDITDQVKLSSLLDRYELTPFKEQLAGTLSGGYKRRLALPWHMNQRYSFLMNLLLELTRSHVNFFGMIFTAYALKGRHYLSLLTTWKKPSAAINWHFYQPVRKLQKDLQKRLNRNSITPVCIQPTSLIVLSFAMH